MVYVHHSNVNSSFLAIDDLIQCKNYKLITTKGSFGNVYKFNDKYGTKYAAKVIKGIDYEQFNYEVQTHLSFEKEGIAPRLKAIIRYNNKDYTDISKQDFNKESVRYNYIIIMDLYDMDVSELLKIYKYNFEKAKKEGDKHSMRLNKLRTLDLIKSMINVYEKSMNTRLCCLDIKPENFVVNTLEFNKYKHDVKMIDYGVDWVCILNRKQENNFEELRNMLCTYKNGYNTDDLKKYIKFIVMLTLLKLLCYHRQYVDLLPNVIRLFKKYIRIGIKEDKEFIKGLINTIINKEVDIYPLLKEYYKSIRDKPEEIMVKILIDDIYKYNSELDLIEYNRYKKYI